MKIAFLCESSADAAAYSLLTSSLLDAEMQPVESIAHQARGWPSALAIVPALIRQLHYHTDADALVIIVDSNSTDVHTNEHLEEPSQRCRLCLLNFCVDRVTSQLRPMSGRSELKIATGLAVPSVEAWLLTGRNPQVSEAAWRTALASEEPPPYTTNELKRQVYGMDRPHLSHETQRMEEEMQRIIDRDDLLTLLLEKFPDGYGHYARAVRSWE